MFATARRISTVMGLSRILEVGTVPKTIWKPDAIAFEIDAASDHPVAIVTISTPDGVIEIVAELTEREDVLVCSGVHVQSELGPNGLGLARLRQIADAALERLDYNVIEIEGATRTSGAGPGRTPQRLRFTRRRRVAT
jgi:hypothetical protein